MAKNKKTNGTNMKAEEASALARKWKDRLTAARDNQKKVFDKAKESYDVYYAIMSDDEKAKNWRSNTFLPILPGKAREAKAKLSILEPRFQVTPADAWKVKGKELVFDDDAVAKALKVSKKLDREFVNYQSDGGLPPRATVDFSVTDSIVAGWGLALAPLNTFKKVYNQYSELVDGEGEKSAYVDREKMTRKELLRVRTGLDYVDIFKAFISPLAKSWERPFWVMIEREETYEGMMRKNSKKGEQIYDIPAALKDAKPVQPDKNEYQATRDRVFGYAADGSDYKDESVDLFTLYDCYDEDTNEFLTFILANIPGNDSDWVLLRRMQNPYNHGFIPIIPFHTKRRPNSPFGESFLELSKDVQYAFNAAYNQFDDNAKISGETMAIVDKNSIISGFDVRPGGTIEYDSLNGEKPEPWTFNTPNPAILGAQVEILEKSIESGTTPQYASGQVNSNLDKTAGTKGGIGMLMEAANDKISEMYRELKGSLLRYGYIAMHNAQQYQSYIEVIDTPDMSRAGTGTMEKGKIHADFLTPSELQECFDLDIDDESLLPMTRSERRMMFVEFVNLLVEFQKASGQQVEMSGRKEDLMRLDWPDITKELGNAYGKLNAPAFIMKPMTKKDIKQQEIDAATTEQQATDEASKLAQQNNPGADVQQDPNGLIVQRQKRELSNFKDYPADVKNAVLADMGYPESQIVAEQAQAQLAEAQGTQLDTQVKQQMIDAANRGVLDPATLAKFVGK